MPLMCMLRRAPQITLSVAFRDRPVSSCGLAAFTAIKRWHGGGFAYRRGRPLPEAVREDSPRSCRSPREAVSLGTAYAQGIESGISRKPALRGGIRQDSRPPDTRDDAIQAVAADHLGRRPPGRGGAWLGRRGKLGGTPRCLVPQPHIASMTPINSLPAGLRE